MGVSEGTITLGEFLVAAKCLESKWNLVGSSFPHWKWVACSRFPYSASHNEEGYLVLQDVLKVLDDEKASAGSEEVEVVDETILVENQKAHVYDFHIVYNPSYQVPVMYFYGRSLDGQHLGFDDFEQDLPLNSLDVLKKAKWTFITREDHPFLKRPWFMLHPCGTSEWMKLLQNGRIMNRESIVEQYLFSWLSVVGQAVGLKVSFDLLRKPQVSVKDDCFTEVVDMLVQNERKS